MISVSGMCRAASTAKRIISTAPIAKLVEIEPGGADHAVDARIDARDGIVDRGLRRAEVDHDVGVTEQIWEHGVEPRVGASGEEGIVSLRDRLADGLPHP